ncbi:hypothetical protein J6590_003928 [Homalodisca vitripennis]|nr:hypothetical protein J6590_003928 [Homalodisca vitripennis]
MRQNISRVQLSEAPTWDNNTVIRAASACAHALSQEVVVHQISCLLYNISSGSQACCELSQREIRETDKKGGLDGRVSGENRVSGGTGTALQRSAVRKCNSGRNTLGLG